MTGETYTVPFAPTFDLRASRHGGSVTVWDSPSAVFGIGPDHLSALLDFHAAVRETIDVLGTRRCSRAMRARLRYLRDRIAPSPVSVAR